MRGIVKRVSTATLLTLSLCCMLLFSGCSTHKLFVLLNAGEYDKAYETFLEIQEEDYEKLIEKTKNYIQSTEENYKDGKIPLEVALERFASIEEFQLPNLDNTLNSAVCNVLDFYVEQVSSDLDTYEIQDVADTFSSISTLYPYYSMYVNPFISAHDSLMQMYIDREIAKVYEGTLDIEDFQSAMYSLVDNGNLYSLTYDAVYEYENFQTIEESFKSGKEHYENGNYQEAITLLRYVPESSIHYNESQQLIESAKSKYADELFAEAEMYAINHYYEQAIYILNDLLNYGYDYTKVSNKITEYQNAKAEYNLLTEFEIIASDARKSAGKGDYESALTGIQNFADEYYYEMSDEVWNQVQEVYNEIESAYVSLIAGKVEALYNSGDYLSAISMLDNAITEDQRFDDLRAKIEAVKPTYLCEMEEVLVNSDRYGRVTDRIATDTIGNKYPSENVYCIDPQEWIYNNKGYAQYFLGYQYDLLTGIIAPCDTSSNISATLRIIGDDKVIYEIEIQRTTTAIELNLDVSSVNFITFEAECHDSGNLRPLLIDFSFTKSK